MWRMNRARQPGCLTFLMAELAAWSIFLIVRNRIEFSSDIAELLALLGAGIAGVLIALGFSRHSNGKVGPD
jgi:hypothetical protein